jgi:energy-coupling factor transport system ATP-binding protein
MRRVALASVLCIQPEVLILDEPTAGLDPQGRRTLLSNVQSWGANTHGLTLLVVSHNLGHLAHLVERVIVLARGHLVADGPVREVLGNPDLLQAAGLEVPPPVELLYALRRAGWSVRTDLLTPQEAAAEIARVYGLREAI